MDKVAHSQVFKFTEQLPVMSYLDDWKDKLRLEVFGLLLFLGLTVYAFATLPNNGEGIFQKAIFPVLAAVVVVFICKGFNRKERLGQEFSDVVDRIANESFPQVDVWAEPLKLWTCYNDTERDYRGSIVHDGFSLGHAIRSFVESSKAGGVVESTVRLYEDLGGGDFQSTETWVSVTYTVLDAHSFRVEVSEPYERETQDETI